MLILAGGGVGSWLHGQRESALNREVQQSYRRLNDVDRLYDLLDDAEAGVRAYALAGERGLARPYEEAQRSWRDALKPVQQVAALQEGGAERAAQLEGLVRRYLQILGSSVQLRESRGGAAATREAERGAQTEDDIRRLVSSFKSGEQVRINGVAAQAAHSSRWALWTSVASSAWAVLLAASSLWSLQSDIRRREKAEAELEQGRALLQQFVEHTPAAVAMFDAQGEPILRSRRWQFDVEGRQPNSAQEAAAGGDADEPIHPDDCAECAARGSRDALPQGWDEAMARSLGGHVERREEDVIEREDGGRDWVRWEMRPWQAPGGGVGGAIAFVEDITPRKSAEDDLRRSEARYREVVDSVHEVIFRTDAAGRWSFLSRAWHDITGFDPHEALGQPASDWLRPLAAGGCSLLFSPLSGAAGAGKAAQGAPGECSCEVLVRTRAPASDENLDGAGATRAVALAASEPVGEEFRRCEVVARVIVDESGRP
jgi:PAS domain-containing protein